MGKKICGRFWLDWAGNGQIGNLAGVWKAEADKGSKKKDEKGRVAGRDGVGRYLAD